jgi:hypothetical protein
VELPPNAGRRAAPSVARGAGLAFGAALALTLIMAAPVLVEPGQRIFGSGRTLGRDDPNRDPLIVIGQFGGEPVPSPYLQPLTDLPGRGLAVLVGPVAAYNLVVLATFPLAAAAAYLLGRRVLGSHPGAMTAGLAYAFLPYHVTQAAGHPHVAQTQWMPLYLLALWSCVDRPGLFRATLLVASAAAVALADFYAGFVAAVMSPVALAAYGFASPRGTSWRRVAATALVLLAAAAGGVLLVRHLVPAVVGSPGSLGVPRAELFAWSARWWSYLVPPVEHPLLGPRARSFWSAHGVSDSRLEHQQLSVGWSLLALGALPVWHWLRGRRESLAVRNASVFVVLAAAAVVTSLSPERTIGAITLVRPSAWLYELAPMFRAYARFGVVVGLMTALLAGGGVSCLWSTRRGRLAAALLLGLAVVEFAPFPPWPWRDVLPTRAHRWLAAQPEPLRVLDCVPPDRMSDVLAPRLLGHDTSLLGQSTIEDCGEPRLGEALAARRFTHVVVRRDSAAAAWLAGPWPRHGLARGPAFEDSWILEVTAAPPRLFVGAWLGFQPREYGPNKAWRWMGQTGALRLVASKESPGTVLDLELKAFPRERRVAWLLDGRRLGELLVTPEWRRYQLPLGALPPGGAMVTLACLDPAVAAADVLGNRDPRLLGLAVGDWQLAKP